MHFGVNSATEILNEDVGKVVAQDPTTTSICGDILVLGETLGKHEKALRQNYTASVQEQGLFLGLKKSRRNLQAVNVFLEVFSSKGISQHHEKVAALKATRPLLSAAKVHFLLFSIRGKLVNNNVQFL